MKTGTSAQIRNLIYCKIATHGRYQKDFTLIAKNTKGSMEVLERGNHYCDYHEYDITVAVGGCLWTPEVTL